MTQGFGGEKKLFSGKPETLKPNVDLGKIATVSRQDRVESRMVLEVEH